MDSLEPRGVAALDTQRQCQLPNSRQQVPTAREDRQQLLPFVGSVQVISEGACALLVQKYLLYYYTAQILTPTSRNVQTLTPLFGSLQQPQHLCHTHARAYAGRGRDRCPRLQLVGAWSEVVI